ncbi:hypothetical protein M0R04_09380 [Candidatus Dojkabacteria bacterium]|jgi:hypothetical protein|nr:hypothetical protein [Candidatus Dojkabacteria bacterium]
MKNMASKKQIAIICDNGGGYTVMIYASNYAYCNEGYPGPVADILESLVTGDDDPSCWDGNNNDAWMGYNYQDEANGGYRWYTGTARQIIKRLKKELREEYCWGRNVEMLAKELKDRGL